MQPLFSVGYEYNANCMEAHNAIFRLQFNRAVGILTREKQLNPGNHIPVLLENTIDFLKVFCNEDSKDLEKFKNSRDKRLEFLEKGDKNDPYYNWCRAEVYLQYAMSRVKFEEYITAVREIRKAYVLLEENKKKFPDFLPNIKSLGILHTIIGSIPDQYQWVTKLLSIGGSQQQGVDEMKKVIEISEKSPDLAFLHIETVLMLSWISFTLDMGKKEMASIDSYYKQTTVISAVHSSPLMAYTYAYFLIRYGRNDDALKVLFNSKDQLDTYPLYYTTYLTGIALLSRLDTASAKYFRYFNYKYQGRNYIKSSNYRLALISLLKGRPDDYKTIMNTVLHVGNTTIEADKVAQFEAKSGLIPNVSLLKARLLFDGGYYQKSEEQLKLCNSRGILKNKRDSLEYNYRYARIYQMQDKTEPAIQIFQNSIAEGKGYPWYFAANSALILATIYEEKHNFTLAKKYYHQCLDMDYEEFQSSISIKAKSGLRRIEKR